MDVLPVNNYFEMGTADCVGEPTMSKKLTLNLFDLNMKEMSKPFILNEKKNLVKWNKNSVIEFAVDNVNEL